MKTRKFRIITWLLMVVMFVSLSFHSYAAASPAVTKDGLTVQVLTDKDSYKADETIKAVVRVDNNTGRRVVVETGIQLPKGVSLVSEENAIGAILQPAEYWTTPEGFSLLAGDLAIANPSTGDNLEAGFWVIMTVLAVCGLFVLFVYGKNKKTWVSILLCLTMVGGMVTAAIPTQAEEITGTIKASCQVEIEGKTKEIIATVNYTILDEEEENAESQPTEEPAATPKPSEEPTATPEPSEEPTVTPEPSEEPTVTPEPVYVDETLFETDFEQDTAGSTPSEGKGINEWTAIVENAEKMLYAKVEAESEKDNQILHVYAAAGGKAGGPRGARDISIVDKDNLTIEFKARTDAETPAYVQWHVENPAVTLWSGVSEAWTQVKLVLDLKNSTYVTYVDGILMEEIGTLTIPEGTETLQFRFHGGTLQPGTGVYFDDIKISSVVEVTADQILTPNNTVNWSNVKPTEELSDESFVNNMTAHPRIFVSKWDEIVTKIDSSDMAAKWYQQLKTAADNALVSGAPERVVNSRGNVLESARAGRDNLQALAFVYQVEKQRSNADANKYLKAAYEQMIEMGVWEDWSGFTSYLVTAELMFGYACAYDWLYDDLTEAQRAEIFEIVQEQSLTALVYNYEGVATSTNFTTNTINWNPVCNGSAISAALAFADEKPEISEYILEKAPEFIVNCLPPYAPEGAYPEGVSYWDYGTSYLIFAADMLGNGFEEGLTLPDEYHYFDKPGMAQTADFPIYFTGPAGRFNYGDCVSGVSSTVSFYWLANQFDKPQYAWYENKVQQDNNSYLKGYEAIAAICFYAPSNVQVTEFSKDKFYGLDKEAEASKGIFNGISMRSDWENDALFAAMQGGYNAANHQHLSTGTYVIDYHGERFVRQLGKYDYSLKDSKNELYYKRAEASNTLVINPSLAADQELKGYANLIESGSGSDTSFGILDMSKAYTAGDATILSAKRGMMLTDNRNRVVIQDEVELDKASEFYWYANTDASAKIAADKKSAILTLNGERMLVRIINGPDSAAFEMVEAKSTIEGVKNDICGEQKLAIHVTGVSELNLAVEYVGLEDGEGIPAAGTYIPLADWTAKDKTIESSEGLEITVKVDGEALSFFEMDREQYALDYVSTVSAVPQVTVEVTGNSSAVTEASSNVIQATAFGVYGTNAADADGDGVADDTAKVTVTAGDKTYTYYIKIQRNPFEGILSITDPGVLNALKATLGDVTLPSEYTYIYVEDLEDSTEWATYPERGIVDGVINEDISDKVNRWASDAEGCWIMMDFGETHNLHSMAFAGVTQKERQYLFDVCVSETGNENDWTQVHTGGAPMTTETMSVIELYDNATAEQKEALEKVRYVKMFGQGHIRTDQKKYAWNTWAEVRFYESNEQEQTDISYWPVYFPTNKFEGKAGESETIRLKGIDYFKTEFDLKPEAEISYVFADTSIARVVTESGIDKLEFLKNGTTTLTITATQDGFSASAVIDIVCEGSVDETKYTISFVDHKEASITGADYNFELTKGSVVTVPAGPERASDVAKSYTFKGWELKGAAEGTELIQAGTEITVTGNASYVAVYDATERVYAATLALENGTVLQEWKCKLNDEITLPSSMEVIDTQNSKYTQYTFNQWTIGENTVNPGYKAAVTEDVTYVAKKGDYSAVENTLLFYTDGSYANDKNQPDNKSNPGITQFNSLTEATGEKDGVNRELIVRLAEDPTDNTNQVIKLYGTEKHAGSASSPRATRNIAMTDITELIIEAKAMVALTSTDEYEQAYISLCDGTKDNNPTVWSDNTVVTAGQAPSWKYVKIKLSHDAQSGTWTSNTYVDNELIKMYQNVEITLSKDKTIEVRFNGKVSRGDCVYYDDIKIYVPPVTAAPPAQEVTVRFVDDAGQLISEYTWEGLANTQVTMPAGSSKEAVENCTYTFAGWKKVDANGEVCGEAIAANASIIPTADVTYKAVYTYTKTLFKTDLEGETVDTTPTIPSEKGVDDWSEFSTIKDGYGVKVVDNQGEGYGKALYVYGVSGGETQTPRAKREVTIPDNAEKVLIEFDVKTTDEKLNAALKIKCPNTSGVTEIALYQKNPLAWQHVKVEININAEKEGTFNTYIGTDTAAHKSGTISSVTGNAMLNFNGGYVNGANGLYLDNIIVTASGAAE